MIFSVIIPTCNGAALLAKLLTSINQQTARPQDVIIIDSSSEDDTVKIARSFGAKIITIPKAEYDHGRSRTLAAEKAVGDYIIYMTQDSVPASTDCFERLLQSFNSDADIAAAYGRQVPAPGASLFAQHLRQFNYSNQSCIRRYRDKERLGLQAAFLSNSFAAYHKKDLESVGYFQPGLIFGEDMHCAAKLLKTGKKIAYNAETKVFHSHNYSAADDYRRYFDIGVFHQQQNRLLSEFGTPRRHGFRYMKSELVFIIKQKKYLYVFVSLYRTFMKFAGYVCGRMHRYLPRQLNKKLSVNQSWWERSL